MTLEHHATSPSGSAKWLNCAGSPKAESEYENTSSPAAAEGTAAHELAEKTLKDPDHNANDYIGELMYTGEDGTEYHATEEMVEYVQGYVDYVMGLVKKHNAQLLVEVRVNLDRIIPTGFGTADVILITQNKIIVVDFKYGQNVLVIAKNNTQGLCYAVGAYEEFAWAYSFEEVGIHIYQPRIHNISHWDIKVKELNEWADYAHSRWKLTQAEDAERTAGLSQCKYCLAKDNCSEHKAFVFQELIEDFNDFDSAEDAIVEGEVIDVESSEYRVQVAILEKSSMIKKAIDTAKEQLEKAVLVDGELVVGIKAVRGRGSQGYVDEEKALAAFQRKLGLDVIAPRKILTPPQLAKLKDKDGEALKGSRLYDSHVVRKEGAITIAPISDKRKEVDLAAELEEDFADIENSKTDGDYDDI